MGFLLKKRETLADGLKRVLFEEAHALEEDISIAREKSVEGIHEARKHCKRLRALLRMALPSLQNFSQKENDAFRDIARSLASFRDTAARLEAFDSLISSGEQTKYSAIRQALSHDHEAAETQYLDSALDASTQKTQTAIARIRKIRLPQDSECGNFIAKGLRHTYRAGRKAMKNTVISSTGAAFHTWRKRVKDLCYQMQFLQKLKSRHLEFYCEEIDALGELLGQEHDLSVLQQTISGLPAATIPRRLLHSFAARLQQRRHALRSEARCLGEEVYAQKPKAFVRRINRWEAKREAKFRH